MRFRPSEWLVFAFFGYASVLAVTLDLRPVVVWAALVSNALVVCGLLLLAWVEPLRRPPLLSALRDWYKLPLLLLAYREMGWFAPPSHDFRLEMSWIVWDRMLLREWGLKAAIEAFSPVLPMLLEVSYTLVYTIFPFSLAYLYLTRREARTESFLFQSLVGVLLSYALFPCFPSEPPRTVFPGEDFPSVASPFRAFNFGLLGQYGIHTSVFPSAHVSGAFSSALAMVRLVPERPWVGRGLVALACLITTATVYGRYHYAVDAAAGLAVAGVAAVSARLIGDANAA